jgi:hypothetical protein
MWSPALSSVSSVLLMAAMPLPSTSAASVPATKTSQPHDDRCGKCMLLLAAMQLRVN